LPFDPLAPPAEIEKLAEERESAINARRVRQFV
jgi:hypothetical protein